MGGKSHQKPASGLMCNPPVFLPAVIAKHFYYITIKRKLMCADHYMLSRVSLSSGEVIFRAKREKEEVGNEEGEGEKGTDRNRKRDRGEEN